ncbi:MAG: hypothetical protein AAGI48_12305 [Verrucomicrobiota bacterium]
MKVATAILLLLLPSTGAAKDPGGAILEKLDRIVIPVIDFEDTSDEEAIDYLRVRSIELDKNEPHENRGISFIIREPRDKDGGDGLELQGEARVARIDRLQAKNITLSEALIAVCNKTGLDAYITTTGILIQPIGSDLPATLKGQKPEVLKKLTPGQKPQED